LTDTKRLKDRIDQSGLKLQWIAEQLGLTRFGLYKKLSGESDFRQQEIAKLSEILELSAEDRDALFFAPKVEKNSTEGGEA
jgi:DNA-binding phage protein